MNVDHLIVSLGYWAVLIFVAAESLDIPLPGETTLIAAGAYAGATHHLDPWAIFAVASVAAIAGDNVGYWIGVKGGYRLARRYGAKVRLDERKLKVGRYIFDRHGTKVVFFGRFVVVLRTYAAFLAGTSRMAWRRFLSANAAGGILWAGTTPSPPTRRARRFVTSRVGEDRPGPRCPRCGRHRGRDARGPTLGQRARRASRARLPRTPRRMRPTSTGSCGHPPSSPEHGRIGCPWRSLGDTWEVPGRRRMDRVIRTPCRESPHTGAVGPDPAVASVRARRRRWPRRCVALVGCLLVVLALGAAVLLAAVPSVADAQRLVREHLADHGGRAVATPPAKVSAALVAIEDHAFYDLPGVDIAYGVGRLAYSGLRGKAPQGGATLAQQLAKNLYTGPGGGVFHEIEEVGLAFKLELTYSHAQLLDMYLNDAYFGDDAYGVSEAARRYFGQRPGHLGWAQAALLAGLVQAPSAYDPVRHPQAARQRRAEVLDQLVETGALSAIEAHDIDASAILPQPR